MNLLIGGTGSLGRLIAHRLLNSGEPVRALVRERSNYSSLQSARAEVALGDLKNRRTLERACVGAERIIATATAAARGGDDTIEAVDQDGYADLIEVAAAAGVRQFVYVSAHGFTREAPVSLARAKAATEEALRSSGMSFTILRPALFMESWISMILGSQLQLGQKVMVMGDPDLPLPFVSTGNVADLAIAVIGHPDSDRVTLPLSAQAVSYRQIIDWIDASTSRNIEIESVPAGTAIPGLPALVLELWGWLASGQIEPIETVGVAMRYGLTLETPRQFVDRNFGKSTLL